MVASGLRDLKQESFEIIITRDIAQPDSAVDNGNKQINPREDRNQNIWQAVRRGHVYTT